MKTAKQKRDTFAMLERQAEAEINQQRRDGLQPEYDSKTDPRPHICENCLRICLGRDIAVTRELEMGTDESQVVECCTKCKGKWTFTRDIERAFKMHKRRRK
jgi:hypothetical protein